MFEGTRLSYIVPGYTGHIPKVQANDPIKQENKLPKYHIPGYQGYIPSVKAENMIGKTYGKITYTISNGDYHQGQDIPREIRYKSSQADQFVDQCKVIQRTAAEIVGIVPKQPKYEVFETSAQKSQILQKVIAQDSLKKAQALIGEQGKEDKLNQSAKLFYGDNEIQPLKIGEPVPGYTGFNERIQAANIFGQTYANSRKTAQVDKTNIQTEKINNFIQQSTIVPPIKR